MKFFSKYANLQVLLPDGKKIRFNKGMCDASKEEEKELKKLPSFGATLWCDEPKKK